MVPDTKNEPNRFGSVRFRSVPFDSYNSDMGTVASKIPSSVGDELSQVREDLRTFTLEWQISRGPPKGIDMQRIEQGGRRAQAQTQGSM